MRKIFLSAFISLSVWANAQIVNPTEKKIVLGKVTADSWSSAVEQGTVENLKENFVKFLNKGYKLNAKKSKTGVVAKEATINQVINRRGDLYAQFTNEAGKPEISVAFLMGYDIYLNTKDNPQEMARLRDFVREFVLFHYGDLYANQVKEQEKLIGQLNKQILDNDREAKRLESKIDNNTKKVAKEVDPLKKVGIDNQNIEYRNQIKGLGEKNANIKTQIANAESRSAELVMKQKMLAQDPTPNKETTPVQEEKK
jgi:hypothetical protein